jgi:hypothetical protein
MQDGGYCVDLGHFCALTLVLRPLPRLLGIRGSLTQSSCLPHTVQRQLGRICRYSRLANKVRTLKDYTNALI